METDSQPAEPIDSGGEGEQEGAQESIGDEWWQPLAWDVSGGGQRERFSEAARAQVGARIDGGAFAIQPRN